jgi:putative sterol carrier protein
VSEQGHHPAASAVRGELEKAVAKFNERARTDPKFQETLKDVERRIQLDVDGDASYHFHLKENHIEGVKDGPTTNPDVVVTTDKETLLGIFSGEVSAMRAYMTKRIKFKATLMDLLVLKKLF